MVKQIGEVLQGRRERMGLTLTELEKRTHIKRQTLIHIEKNDFESLQYPKYAKGFIQKYAQAVNMDGDLLISEHEHELPTSHYQAKETLKKLRENPDQFQLNVSTYESKWLMIFIGSSILITSVLWGILYLML
nr:helix-turn-helix domain-containing protein [Staphylococcus hyicus]